jgi:hypothetical protein
MLLAFLALAQSAGPDLSGAASDEVGRQYCKPGETDEITVCGRRDRDERYRMPDRNKPFDPDGDAPSVMRERSQWIEGGESGTGSCSPVGQNGFTGCVAKDWEKQRQQDAWGKNRPKKKWRVGVGAGGR